MLPSLVRREGSFGGFWLSVWWTIMYLGEVISNGPCLGAWAPHWLVVITDAVKPIFFSRLRLLLDVCLTLRLRTIVQAVSILEVRLLIQLLFTTRGETVLAYLKA